MNVRRELQSAEAPDEGGPFRSLYVEGQDMKIYYELDEDEVEEAIKEWLVNNHKIQLHDSRLMFFDKQGSSGDRMHKAERIGVLDRYIVTIEDEA